MNRELSTKQICLIILLLFSFALSHNVKAVEQPIVSGSNFNLYFSSGSKLNFQHVKSLYGTGFISFVAKVLVESGTLNGTNGYIRMYEDSGKLKFTSQDTATLKPVNASIYVNNQKFTQATQIQNGDIVTIQWGAIWPVYKPAFPVMFVFGMIGLGAMFGGPLYAIQKVKQHDYYDGIFTGFVLTVIGICFFIAWLWG